MGNLTITATKLAKQDGRLAPFVQIKWQWYSLETKPSLLAAGIASIQAVTTDLDPDWDHDGFDFAILPADPENGRPEPMRIDDATTNPEIVALARRAAELLASDHAQAGPLQ